MVYSTEFGLFQALEQVLKGAEKPMTCNELFDLPEIKKYANSANRVSDYLGGLFRKRMVVRLPAPRTNNSSARWAYEWRRPEAEEAQDPRGGDRVVYESSKVLMDKPSIQITEDGKIITIDMPALTITIRTK